MKTGKTNIEVIRKMEKKHMKTIYSIKYYTGSPQLDDKSIGEEF